MTSARPADLLLAGDPGFVAFGAPDEGPPAWGGGASDLDSDPDSAQDDFSTRLAAFVAAHPRLLAAAAQADTRVVGGAAGAFLLLAGDSDEESSGDDFAPPPPPSGRRSPHELGGAGPAGGERERACACAAADEGPHSDGRGCACAAGDESPRPLASGQIRVCACAAGERSDSSLGGSCACLGPVVGGRSGSPG